MFWTQLLRSSQPLVRSYGQTTRSLNTTGEQIFVLSSGIDWHRLKLFPYVSSASVRSPDKWWRPWSNTSLLPFDIIQMCNMRSSEGKRTVHWRPSTVFSLNDWPTVKEMTVVRMLVYVLMDRLSPCWLISTEGLAAAVTAIFLSKTFTPVRPTNTADGPLSF